MDLNLRSDLTALDPKNMLGLIEGFPLQCRTALSIARAFDFESAVQAPNVVVLCGMGGSAAGGDFVRAIYEAEASVPFQVVRDYDLPNFVDSRSLVFIASYSGNTEETLSAYHQAQARGATIITVTSGGEIGRLSHEHGHRVITVPGGQPPRSALGLMLIPVLWASQGLGLISEQDYEAALSGLDRIGAELGPDAPDNAAMRLAKDVVGKVTVCYGLGGYRGYIANRWRCQFNENAKFLLFANAFPELCHNEIMGWVAAEKQASNYAAIVLEDGHESVRMTTRAAVTADVIGAEKVTFHHVRGSGERLLEKMLTLTFIGDWVSIYLARLNEVDPTQIENIDRLKDALAALDE
jgi:glucose/mannose-6-phosphate isomerase